MASNQLDEYLAMAMPGERGEGIMTYASRNWHAIETPDLVGPNAALTVTGEVQTTQGGQIPALAKAPPQGDSPATLTLNLSVTGGIGPEVLVWTPVVFVT